MNQEKSFSGKLVNILKGLRTGDKSFEELDNFIASQPLPVRTQEPQYINCVDCIGPVEKKYLGLE